MKKLILIFFTIISLNADSSKEIILTLDKWSFTYEQIQNFKKAYAYGNMIGYPKVMMGILYAESSGFNIKVGDKINKPFERSYGPMQVKLGTYYYLKNSGYITGENITEEEMLIKLITDQDFNIYIGTLFYKFMLDKCGNYTSAISGYNRGNCKSDALAKSYIEKVSNFLNFTNKTKFHYYIKSLIQNS